MSALPAAPASSAPGDEGRSGEVSGRETLSGTELLAWRRSLLAEGGKAADLDWLLDVGGGLSWTELQGVWLHPERSFSLAMTREHIASLWRRHLRTAEPLQYLTGRCPWRNLELTVGPGVLIPRQETELLVDVALALLPSATDPSGSASGGERLWADLGTGAGGLALALALALPTSRGLAVDASSRALEVAAANLKRGGVADRVTLLQGSWWEPLAPWWGRLSLVVANPPYIPSAILATLDPVVRDHEPRQALDGGYDGLAAIRTIADGAVGALAPGGVLLLEHHHDQSLPVRELLTRVGLEKVRSHRDLEGIERFASARRPPHPPAALT